MSRKLKAELLKFIRSRIPLTDKEHDEVAKNEPNLLVSIAAQAMAGIIEEGGNNAGKLVEMIQYAGGGSRGQAWCMYLVQAAIRYVELHSGYASPIFVSGGVKTTADRSPTVTKGNLVVSGSIICWLHGSGPQGHAGIITDVAEGLYFTVEGNTSNGVGINRDGDGVYHRMRRQGGEGKMKLYAILTPFPEHVL